MPRSPSIMPQDPDHDTYVVLDAVGVWEGRAWPDGKDSDRETLIRDLMDDRYGHPVRIVVFNTVEGWSRNVTTEIAAELRQRSAEGEDIPPSLQHLLELARR